MPALQEPGRWRFAAGRIASKREELTHLEARAQMSRQIWENYRTHANEIEMHVAEQRLADFREAHPWLR